MDQCETRCYAQRGARAHTGCIAGAGRTCARSHARGYRAPASGPAGSRGFSVGEPGHARAIGSGPTNNARIHVTPTAGSQRGAHSSSLSSCSILRPSPIPRTRIETSWISSTSRRVVARPKRTLDSSPIRSCFDVFAGKQDLMVAEGSRSSYAIRFACSRSISSGARRHSCVRWKSCAIATRTDSVKDALLWVFGWGRARQQIA